MKRAPSSATQLSSLQYSGRDITPWQSHSDLLNIQHLLKHSGTPISHRLIFPSTVHSHSTGLIDKSARGTNETEISSFCPTRDLNLKSLTDSLEL